MKKWLMAEYRRLSADEIKSEKDESNSVTNQGKMIQYYLEDKKDIKIYKSYVDDGYTGTDFDRPGYKQMIQDIKKGKVNGIIIKDLSRLGRNYIEVGNFLDEIVPCYNLRFISINDNVDSLHNPDFMNSLEIPLKNLMNEGYSRDSSKKMRSNLRASKKSGNFIGKNAPFGYLKDEDDCHQLIIDPDAAKIVKKIFDLAFEGKSKSQIIKILNNKNIPTPSVYLKNKYNIKVTCISDKWNTKMIDYILKNENYIGYSVQGKRTRISHKTHNIVRVAEDDWIIYKDHHDSIVKQEIYEQVQSILYNRNIRTNKDGKLYKYSGFLKCSECGSNLYRLSKTKNNKKIVFYYCGTYLNTKNCNKHYITEKELDNQVLLILNTFIKLVCDVESKIDDTVLFSKVEYNKEIRKIKLNEIDVQLKKYKNLIQELLRDYEQNCISQSDYTDFKEKYMLQINQLNIEKEELLKNKINSYNLEWMKQFKKTGVIKEIDRNIVDCFIDNIYVNNDKSVDINLKFKSEYENTLRYLKNK